eukprot:TRINITY_DN17564_c0_g1_i1.p1 TRINITY_DN17564_c0_g1~~TRINITY_DN17564_c0_g1_i1.p1  ORF type:complete len:256 (+),score=60.76 TRINITY_DN17564_c0_g1_i1:22-789(+)
MTPEFRIALLDWSFQDYCIRKFKSSQELSGTLLMSEDLIRKWEKESIVRQLQLLFIALQLGGDEPESTENLTKSFGWVHREKLEQQDIQEFCRFLFDALQSSLESRLIDDLYAGQLSDLVRCLHCDRENSRRDKFLDLQLGIKRYGQQKSVDSLEEAISNLSEWEVLEGDDQYYCENCKCKRNAHKRLLITRLPYILTLQLKRFDYDVAMARRRKLNDRVTFPEVLDMNDYIQNLKEEDVLIDESMMRIKEESGG